MPLKDKSITKSLKSHTNNPTSANVGSSSEETRTQSVTKTRGSSRNSAGTGTGSDTPIQFVKGVGPKLGATFNSRDIRTVKDLLHFFPRTYEDRSQVMKVADLTDGASATLTLKVQSQRQIPIKKFGRSMLEVRCADESGSLNLKWFHAPWGMEKKFIPGTQIVVNGKIKFFMNRPEILHPEITWGVDSAEGGAVEPHHNFGRVVPVYTEIEGVPTRTLRKVLWEALEKFGNTLHEDLPLRLLQKHRLPVLSDAVRSLHFPPEKDDFNVTSLAEFDTPAHRRLIYGEFFKFEYLMLRQKLNVERTLALPFGHAGGQARVQQLIDRLPFQLTGGQKQALSDVMEDFKQQYPMNRLIQGDVGSGKTAIAFLSAACVMAEGSQAALMAPTEILAEQHFKSAFKLFQGQLNVALLTGKTTNSERVALQKRLSSGEPLLLIGTHALIEEAVVFSKLGFVMVDEQHRFGVEQRRALKLKGTNPHSMILTATPIPRTLALTAFGDLNVTTIRELPPGRSPIVTQVIRDRMQRARVYENVKKELELGRQAYFIYPLVNDSEAEGFTQLKSAVAEAETLAEEVFPGVPIGLLHGQMKPEEKAAIMDRFQKGEVKILVSTTVVEVGVDVPNATIMAIEHSERFGLSQLHQLRGRVGRGKFQSYCYLFANQFSGGTTAQRLEVLEETSDGFKIAEADLELRGPGEFLGTRQAGGLPFRLANLVRDKELLEQARDDATEIMRTDPELTRPEHLTLRTYYETEGGVQFDRLKTS